MSLTKTDKSMGADNMGIDFDILTVWRYAQGFGSRQHCGNGAAERQVVKLTLTMTFHDCPWGLAYCVWNQQCD
ncbi:hypothetical protein MY1884_001995 [Beauveria asiatica]